MTARLLMIALDSADCFLLDRWSSDGSLPSLAALRQRGGTKLLTAPRGTSDDGLWASFQFGAGLSEHGRYHWEQLLDSGELGMAYLDESNRKSFWETLSERGERIAVFDIPKCGSPRPVNGIHLVDWLVHGRYLSEPQSYPEELAGEVVSGFGAAPPSVCGYHRAGLDDNDVEEVTRNLQRSVAQKREAALHFLSSESWDLFMVGFKEAHCAGHHLWNLIDRCHPEYNESRMNRLGDPVKRIFQELDKAVGDLIAAAGDSAVVAVFSNSSMATNSSLTHLMPGVVRAINRELFQLAGRSFWRRVLYRPAPEIVQILPCNDNCTALRVKASSAGDAPGDIEVRKARVLEQVEAMLHELMDTETGLPILLSIDRPSAGQGEYATRVLPDLLIHYPPGVVPSVVSSQRLGRIAAKRPPIRPGNHAPGGILYLTGESADGIDSVENFGRFAARVLGVSL